MPRLMVVMLALLLGVAGELGAQESRRLEHAAAGERRVALVIGNNAYSHATPLRTAVADAEAVAAKLRSLGVDVVLRTDVARQRMNRAVDEFVAKL